MANNKDQFTTEIYVNQEQANTAMEKLREKVDQTAKAYEKLLNTKDADSAKTEKARKAWEAAKKSLENAETGVAEYQKALKNLTGQSMDRLLRMQRQINAELKKTKPNTAEWHKLANEYAQVTNRIKSLRDAQESVVNKSKGFKGALDRLTAAGNKFGMTLLAIPTAIKGVTSALSGVIDVTKQVINASQTMGDKWNNGMAAMKTTTDAFFMALSSGDWSAFNDGITSALKKARELAEQLDLLGDYDISDKVLQSKYVSDFNAARVIATDPEASTEEQQKAIEKMEDAMNHYTAFVKDKAKETWEGLTDQFDAWKGIQFDTAEEFERFFVHYYEYGTTARDETVENMKAAKAAVDDAEQSLQILGMGMVTDGNVWQRASDRLKTAKEEYDKLYASATKEQKAILAALELPDDKKNAAADLYASYTASLEKASSMGRSFNRTQKQVNSTIGETTKTTNTATKATDAYTEAIKKLDKAESAQLITLKKLYASGIMDKATYEAQKAVVEEDYLKQRMATAQKYGKDTDKFMSQLLDKQIARMEKAKALLKEEMAEMEKSYIAEHPDQNMSDEDFAKLQNQQRRQGYKEKLGTIPGETDEEFDARIEQYEASQKILWEKAADIRNAITEDSARTQYEIEMKWIEKLHRDGMLSDEEYEKAKLDQKLKFAAKIAQEVNRYATMASDFVTALKESETAKLEAEYQKQLAAAGDNAEQREEIEAQYEQKKLDLQKKYADTEMVINIAKALAAGALAAVEAFAAAGGNPVLGGIFAALIAVTTALEVATIVKQRNAIKNASVSSSGGGSSAPKTGERTVTGFSEGGNTGYSPSDNTPMGIVHANEWVAPAWMVRQRPVLFRNLEEYRRQGSARHNVPVSGFANGGPTTGNASGNAANTFQSTDIETAVENGVRRALADEAIRAYVVRKDITELDAQDARLKRQTSRS